MNDRLTAWIEKGGVLIRFAGPRLAAQEGALTPVTLRPTSRSLGSSLSWETPQRIADYWTDLLGIGFSAFRIDAAKHIRPDDLAGIFAKFKANLGGSLPADWFTWLEVLLGGEKDLLICNDDSGYNYGAYLAKALAAVGFTPAEVDQVKLWFSGYPAETDADCGKVSRKREVIQNDDHDQQNPGSSSRDMHDSGSVLVKDKDVAKHRAFEVKLFEAPYGVTDNDNDWPHRAVLSSYWFLDDGTMAPPDGLSDCALCTTNCNGCKGRPHVAAYKPDSVGYDVAGEYTRFHDAAIFPLGLSHLSPFPLQPTISLLSPCPRR